MNHSDALATVGLGGVLLFMVLFVAGVTSPLQSLFGTAAVALLSAVGIAFTYATETSGVYGYAE